MVLQKFLVFCITSQCFFIVSFSRKSISFCFRRSFLLLLDVLDILSHISTFSYPPSASFFWQNVRISSKTSVHTCFRRGAWACRILHFIYTCFYIYIYIYIYIHIIYVYVCVCVCVPLRSPQAYKFQRTSRLINDNDGDYDGDFSCSR